MESGFYDSEAARQRIAGSLLRSGYVREGVDEVRLAKVARELSADDTRPVSYTHLRAHET